MFFKVSQKKKTTSDLFILVNGMILTIEALN